jgi:hypothetical protein
MALLVVGRPPTLRMATLVLTAAGLRERLRRSPSYKPATTIGRPILWR